MCLIRGESHIIGHGYCHRIKTFSHLKNRVADNVQLIAKYLMHNTSEFEAKVIIRSERLNWS